MNFIAHHCLVSETPLTVAEVREGEARYYVARLTKEQ